MLITNPSIKQMAEPKIAQEGNFIMSVNRDRESGSLGQEPPWNHTRGLNISTPLLDQTITRGEKYGQQRKTAE